MWHGWIGQRIAESNKTSQRLSFVIFFLVGCVLMVGSRGLINWHQGPAQMNESALESAGDPTMTFRNYVRVQGEKAFPTGINEETTETRNGSTVRKYVNADFFALKVGSRLLIVKARPGVQATSYQGTLTGVPDDLKERVFRGLDPDIQAAFLPVMVDASVDYIDEDFILWSLGAVVALVVGLMIFIPSKKRAADYAKHPFCKALSQFGPLESLVPQIDGEVMAGFTNFGHSFFATKSWLISFATSAIMRKDDAVWVYPKKSTVRVYFVPVTTHSVVIRDSWGRRIEGSGKSEQEATGILNGLLESMPWVIAGYSADLEKLYANDRTAFTSAVTGRRSKLKNAGAESQ